KTDLTTGYVLPTYTYPINEWTHTVFSYDFNGNYKVYINGDLNSSGQVVDFVNWYIPNSFIRLGVYGTAFLGEISNVLIYSRVLSDEDVKALYSRNRTDAGIIFTPEN
ncbi:MAG: Concanavalin A-like lectin/glucanase superfamily, partial [Patescibacteria group bacterium]|nr:Concanavalin A-like lectin/glucanase superfamily [Patescibacteria group bacterium]